MKEVIKFTRFIIALPILLPILLLFEVFILIGGYPAKELIIKVIERITDSYE